MKQIRIKDFRGGLNKNEPTTLKDNQFEVLKDFTYDSNKRLRTRRGIRDIFAPIPDATALVNALEATTNITATNDAVNLTTGTAIRGANSVSFDIDVSNSANNYATITWAGASTVDISSAKGYVAFWVYVPSGFTTELSSVAFRLGSDSSNYYSWTLGNLNEGENNFVVLQFSDASTTGTPVDTAVDYFLLQVNYTASYTDKLGVLIDSMYCYSDTSTAPVTSYFYHEFDDLTRRVIVASGTNMFQWNEGSEYWEVIMQGLTEFETREDIAGNRTLWDFAVYKDVVYMCNGVDSYRWWDGTAVGIDGAQPKVRYLEYLNDAIVGSGDDSAPSTVYHTDIAALNGQTLDANSIVVGGDEQGRINGMRALGNFFVVMKSNKSYVVTLEPSVTPIDAEVGGYSNRFMVNVSGSMAYFNGASVDVLRQRASVTGATAIESVPLSQDVDPLLTDITARNYNSQCGIYYRDLTNTYFSYDTNDDGVPDSTLVYSALQGVTAWTEYTYSPFYDYGVYKDSDGVFKKISASAVSGSLYEIEVGFDDLGIAIEPELKTKAFDFDAPEVWKDVQFVDLFGLKSQDGQINVEIIIDETVISVANIDDTMVNLYSVQGTVGTRPIGVYPVGYDSGGDDIDLYSYIIRIPIFAGGKQVQIRMYSNDLGLVWTLDKATITTELNTFDIFPNANIA